MSHAQNTPKILIIPGLNNSGPTHWQSEWENILPNASRVHLGGWDHPRRSAWITNLGIAIRQVSGPKILVAHSLGCHAVASWVAHEPDATNSDVIGALLVAPPDVDHVSDDSRLASFKPSPRTFLPFPAILVASSNDPYCDIEQARKLALRWRARFVHAGLFGHLNAESGIGAWPYGLYLLDTLKAQNSPFTNPALVARIEQLRQQRAQREQRL
jgi:uncharacterized protein